MKSEQAEDAPRNRDGEVGRQEDGPRADPREEQRYVQAAMTYGSLGLAVVFLTVVDPELARPERRDDIAVLILALPAVLVFAALMAWGNRLIAAPLSRMGAKPRTAWRVGHQIREKLVMFLTLTAAVRLLIYLGSATGYRLRFAPPGLEAGEPKPAMWLAVVLMSLIAWALFRAGWRSFLERRRLRQ